MPLDVDGKKYKSRSDEPLKQTAYVAEYQSDVYDEFKDKDSDSFRGFMISGAFFDA